MEALQAAETDFAEREEIPGRGELPIPGLPEDPNAPKRRRKPWGLARRMFTAWAMLLILTAVACYGRPDKGLFKDEDGYPRSLPASGVEVPDYVEEQFLPVNRYSRPGAYLGSIRGVVIHYVGNPGSTAKGNRDYFASLASGAEDTYASSHFVVGLEGEVLQCVPLTEVAYASNNRNSDTVSIEVCHPDADGQFRDTTYWRVVELTAWLCETFDIDPETDVIRHYDVTGKRCPRYYVDHPEAWEALREEISIETARLKEETD